MTSQPQSFPMQEASSASSSYRPPYPPGQDSSRTYSYGASTKDPADSLYDMYGEEEDAFDPFSIDPNLRLRTVRTAHSVIAESIRSEHEAEQRKRRRGLFRGLTRRGTRAPKDKEKKRKSSDAKSHAGTVSDAGGADQAHSTPPRKGSVKTVSYPPSPEKTSEKTEETAQSKGKGKAKAELPRRSIYVNTSLPPWAQDKKGEPIVRYVRNKVRTSKYTLVTFLPKNLFEQFRRAANVYFLALVILQSFSIFGATNAKIGMLPLVFILGMTAIKDGIEDWRRAKLDNDVNNSAATKLGGWRNVNQPKDPRSFLERLFGLNAPDKASKGVRRLREKEAKAGHQIVLDTHKAYDEQEELDSAASERGFHMASIPRLSVSSDGTGDDAIQVRVLRNVPSAPSLNSRLSTGVLDFSLQTGGAAHWERTLWKKLEVGDLVLLRDNEQIPADIVVLSSSNDDGLAFVETKNLDGETNLKVRRALKATASIQTEEDLEHARFVIDSEPPHANLYTYNGVLKYHSARDKSEGEQQEAITINELLLRGCTIRNTKWVMGIVVFTGADTKIMLNGGDTPSKRSKIEKETNFNVIMNFAILLILCIVTAILHGWYRSLDNTSADVYEIGSFAAENLYLDSVIIFASCLIVFQNIVPISLYITIEIVKTIQAFFIFQDVEMYYEPYDTPCVPKTWNISDDLGQIEYVFSDKTGTLTQNIMEFKKCSIQGVVFGEGLTEAMMGAAKREGRDIGSEMEDQDEKLDEMKAGMVQEMRKGINNRYFREDQLTLVAPNLPQYLVNPNDPLHPQVVDFFSALAICHSVLADIPEPGKPFEVDYKAESPDEAALVAAARDAGFPFVNRTNARIDIEVLGRPEKWTPLRVLEFNSTRKRMSVIARDPNGRIVLFCKGADSVIYERLRADHDPELKAATLRDLEAFANGGLRTLCISRRYLGEEEYQTWAKKYDAACAAVDDREGAIEQSCETIEHSLEILGATALEDKLQEGVPDAIDMLHRAGIKLWILTGDKLQTAIEIGYSCNLLTNDMEVMIISADSSEGARAQIEAGLNKMASVRGPPAVNGRKGPMGPGTNPTQEFALVIDGDSLRYALQPLLKSLFLSLGTQCSAVICCRVSPSQKALTVKLVKEGCKAMTLSIGDGANDVAMIQEANIGVGLFGLEGSQAAMSADYAFGQFRFLTRLLLVHGRWSYTRIADMHANFFYKNIIWTISMFWFLIFNSFDATYLFEYTFILLFNLAFTSLPVGVLGALDQDTNARVSMAFPQLYTRGIKGLDYTRKRFWLYMTDGLYQSAIIFFIPYLAYGGGVPWSSNGLDTDSLWDFGTTIAIAGVISANLYVGINTRYWTWMTWVVIIGSCALILLWVPIYSYLASLPYYGTVSVIYSTFSFWMIVILTVFCAIGPRWLACAIRQSYAPRDKDIVREAWIAGTLKDELGLPHRSRRKARKAAAAYLAKGGNGGVYGGGSPRRGDPDNEPDFGHIDRDLESGYTLNVKRALGDDVLVGDGGDGRGVYERAAASSPRGQSPVMGSPATTYQTANSSYPPLSPLSADEFGQYTPNGYKSSMRSRTGGVPAPLLAQSLLNNGRRHLQPSSPHTPQMDSNRFSTIEYTSPSALDRMEMAQSEIDRMTGASRELKRASLSGNGGYPSSGPPPTSAVGLTDWQYPSFSSEKRNSSLGMGSRKQPQQQPQENVFSADPQRSVSPAETPERPLRPARSPARQVLDTGFDTPRKGEVTVGAGGVQVQVDEHGRVKGEGGGDRTSYIDFSSPHGRWSVVDSEQQQ